MGSLSESEDIYKDLKLEYQRKECNLEILYDDGRESSTHTEVPSDPWFEEEEFSSNKEFDKSASIITVQESELKNKEIDLYSDLIVIESEKQRDEQKRDTEFEKLKEEVKKLRESDALQVSRITELSAENSNLKKNICSLYKTAKSEIEHKDSLLAEANRKLDNFLFRKNRQSFSHGSFLPEKCRKQPDGKKLNDKQTDDRRTHPNDRRPHPDDRKPHPDDKRPHSDDRKIHPDYRSDYPDNRRASKRKRLDDFPVLSHSENEFTSTAKCSENQESTPQNHSSIPKEANFKSSQRGPSSNVSLQTPDTLKVSSCSRDMTETNCLFFQLLPEPLKQSFHEYEQSQIVTLNKLKQAFVNQYFNYDTNIQTPSIQNTPKQSRALSKQSLFNNNPQNTPSVNRLSLPTPSTHRPEARNNFVQDDLPEIACFNLNVKIDTNKLTKNMQKDLGSLFRYNNERIPFLDKRKFGLLNNGKELVPKCVL